MKTETSTSKEMKKSKWSTAEWDSPLQNKNMLRATESGTRQEKLFAVLTQFFHELLKF
jgi:hypothetical protein